MKHLIPLVLVWALLCGCAQTEPSKEAVPIPTESVVGAATEDPGGTVTTVPLNLDAVQGLCGFHGGLLLFSGRETTTLTLLDSQSLKALAVLTLDFLLSQEDPSLMIHEDGSLSFFDPVSRETVVLDRQLRELRRIAAPGALSGSPILSPDATTLYYCTASHIRAWDLEQAIHRCVKEMAFDGQSLTGIHMDGAILQCRVVTDGGQETLFLSAEDGLLLRQYRENLSLITNGSAYFTWIPAGSYRIAVFGTEESTPRMLLPSDLTARVFFLPEQGAALTVTQPEGSGPQLDCYRLSSGTLVGRMIMSSDISLRAATALDGERLAVLTYEAQHDREALLLWTLPQDSPAVEAGCFTEAYDPDAGAFAQCNAQVEALEEKYGLQILLGEELVSRSFGLNAETLAPVLRRELTLLEQRLAQFPESLLRDACAHFSSVNLCLVRTAGDAGEYFLEGSDAYLPLPVGDQGEQALYHGLYHLMETHILGNSKALDRWDDCNPAGFHYDYDYAANAVRNSGIYLFGENRVFVDTYSMSYPKEDRARILEYALLPGNRQLFQAPALQKKLRALCAGIREAFDLPEGNYLWEQYLE